MNIKGISDNLGSNPIGRVDASRGLRVRNTTAKNAGDDQVDMSKLSKLMAHSAKELEARFDVRQEKLAAFKDDLDSPPDLSNTVIDSIWRRMLGS
jgi:hypothetical protein